MHRFTRTYMTIGLILGIIVSGPRWIEILFGRALPGNLSGILTMLLDLLAATIPGVVRAFVWLPSAVYWLGIKQMAFATWITGTGSFW